MKEKKKISTNVYENILIAVAVMLYFIIINFANISLKEETFLISIKIVSSIIFAMGIILLEVAYHKDSAKIAVHALEVLVLSGLTLSINHIAQIKKISFQNFTLMSSYTFSIYYILKAAILYTKKKKDYVEKLSDIKEIVDIKPEKKEAKKRK